MAQNDSGKFIWFVGGAAIGAAIALLYAPQSGEETRRIIRKKALEGSSAVMDSSGEWIEKGRDLYEKGRQVADDAAELFERGRHIVEG